MRSVNLAMGASAVEKRFVLLKLLFIILSTDSVLTAQDCCPPNTFVVAQLKICSDNVTKYNISCKRGAWLLDPAVEEFDKFSLESDGTVLVHDGQRKQENEFCLGRIKRNDTEYPDQLVALVCFPGELPQPKILALLQLLMLISTLFLVVTLYVYAVLPNLKDLQGKCLIAFICCLIASYISLLVTQTFPNSSLEVCIVEAALLYFFMSATFFWNNIITFNIWKAIRNPSIKIKEKSCTVLYITWGFGVPLSMVLLSFILEHLPDGNHIRPRFGETKCWFKGKTESWAFFYGPISILLILNTAMFLQSTWILWKTYSVSNISTLKSLKFNKSPKKKVFEKQKKSEFRGKYVSIFRYMMYLKLFLLMGISWIFEVLSYATADFENIKYLWIITDCINSAQGILIFLILVVFRQKVRIGLLKKKLFNINWPESWIKEELQESSTEPINEEVEMAQQKSNLLM